MRGGLNKEIRRMSERLKQRIVTVWIKRPETKMEKKAELRFVRCPPWSDHQPVSDTEYSSKRSSKVKVSGCIAAD